MRDSDGPPDRPGDYPSAPARPGSPLGRYPTGPSCSRLGRQTPDPTALTGSDRSPSGPAVLLDGPAVLQNGRVVLLDGGAVLQNGHVVLLDGHVVLLDGHAVLQNGTAVLWDGGEVLQAGGIVRPLEDVSSMVARGPIRTGLLLRTGWSAYTSRDEPQHADRAALDFAGFDPYHDGTGGAVTSSLLVTLLLMSASPLRNGSDTPCLPPPDSGVFMVDTGVAYAYATQDDPAVTSDGRVTLAVWREDPRGLIAARFDDQGTKLDSAILLADASVTLSVQPAAAFSGEVYLVVWVDKTSHPWRLLGARISNTGVLLDSAGFLVAVHGEDPLIPAVAFGDSCFLVSWLTLGSDVFCSRVTPNGTSLDTAGIHIAAGEPYQHGSPDVAFNGSSFWVVWDGKDPHTSRRCIYGARVTEGGVLLDTNGILISLVLGSLNHKVAPSIVGTPAGCFVAWQYSPFSGPGGVQGARLAPSGQVIDTSAIWVTPEGSRAARPEHPRVGFNGRDVLVVWDDEQSDSRDIFAARISLTGRVLDPEGIPACAATNAQFAPVVTGTDSSWFLAWIDQRQDPQIEHVYGAVLGPDGGISRSDLPVAFTRPTRTAQYRPACAALDTQLLVVWESHDHERRPSSQMWATDICAMRLNEEGERLDTRAIHISTHVLQDRDPTVVSGDSVWLVAWEDHRWLYGPPKIYLARVAASGSVLDSLGFLLNPDSDGRTPDAAFDGISFLVAWTDGRSEPARSSVRAARVTQDGIVLDSGGIVLDSSLRYVYDTPAVSADFASCLVVWVHTTSNTIRGARVRHDGVLLDSTPFLVSTTSRAYDPDLAFNGTNYLVVWSGPYSDYIYGTRVSQAGQVLDPDGIRISGRGYNRYSTVVHDDSNWIVTWRDGYSGEPRLMGARVNPHGVVLDTFLIATHGLMGDYPTATAMPGGRVLFTWSGWADSVGGEPFDSLRIWGKFLDFPVGIASPRSTEPAPERFTIRPNPFTRAATIFLGTEPPGDARITFRDATGRLVRDLTASKSRAVWDGRDDEGRALPAGVYFCTVTASGSIERQKVIKME